MNYIKQQTMVGFCWYCSFASYWFFSSLGSAVSVCLFVCLFFTDVFVIYVLKLSVPKLWSTHYVSMHEEINKEKA